MAKKITSPSKRWPGSVTIAEPLTLPQAELIEEALDQRANIQLPEDRRIFYTVLDKPLLPAILACVENWELENFTADPFPFSPRAASHKLIDWLWAEIMAVYTGEAEVPNE